MSNRTDEVLADIDAALDGAYVTWDGTGPDAAVWTADGSHELGNATGPRPAGYGGRFLAAARSVLREDPRHSLWAAGLEEWQLDLFAVGLLDADRNYCRAVLGAAVAAVGARSAPGRSGPP